MMLAGNWNDQHTREVILKSSLIDLDPQARGQQGASKETVQPERLSEKTLSISDGFKRCDSPNPESILLAIQLFEADKTWKQISKETNIPETTVKRYLHKRGYKRDYKFVSKKLTGRKLTAEHRKNISKTRIVEGVAKGKNNPNWNGGLSNPEVGIWNTTEYKLWRKAVFERDNYICKGCGIHNGTGKTVYLEAHHILPRRDFPHLTFDISNGITLCFECHNKTRRKEYASINIWKQRVLRSS